MNLFRKPYLELKRGIVNLKSGTVFRGILYRREGGLQILRQAELIQDRGKAVNGTKPATLDGEVILDASEIDFIQVVD